MRATTDEHDLAAELAALRERYSAIVESSPVGIAVHTKGTIVFINPAALRMLAVDSAEELIGTSALEFVHPEFRAQVADRLASLYERDHEPSPLEQKWIRRDGAEFWVEAVGKFVSWHGEPAGQVVFVDITARKHAVAEAEALEEQLRRARRLESIGRLAGGVAHDFNNMLTAVSGYLEFATRGSQDNPEVLADLAQIGIATQRAADLTSQLLAFARRQSVTPRVLIPAQAVSETWLLVERLVGDDIKLDYDADTRPWAVIADPGQLEQILMNLVVNARDAMPDGGELQIRVTNEIVLESPLASADTDAFVCLSVCDSGGGMDAETQKLIFDPFFSTKELGTGLGLATVYGIVQQAGGFLEVDSALGAGTTFRVFLPRTLEAPKPVPMASERAPSESGAETILLVEDNESIRRVTRRALREEGYCVLAAADGLAALRSSREHEGPIDLLLSDVVMPGMNGRKLAAELRRLRPDMEVLLVSGYPDGAAWQCSDGVAQLDAHEPDDVLQKPYTVEELLGAIRDSLSR